MDNKPFQTSNYFAYYSLYVYTISANNHKLRDFISYPNDLKKKCLLELTHIYGDVVYGAAGSTYVTGEWRPSSPQ